jgi:AcrR family transcriptional regulator
VATHADRLPHSPPDEGNPDRAARGARVLATRAGQRSRLLRAIVEIVGERGFPDAKVADVARSAGVSRATFYELFGSKEACVLTAQADLSAAFLADVEDAIQRAEPDRALRAAVSGIVDFAGREPVVFDFLMHETMLCGVQAQTRRDEVIARVQALVENAWAQAPRGSRSVDVSAQFVLEGTIRLLELRARRDGDDPTRVRDDLMRWVDSYLVTGRAPRWRSPTPEQGLLELPFEHAGGLTVHPALPKGRHRLDSDVARSVQRERITYATAEAIREKGYADVTVADIVAAAGVSRDAFYAQFHDKDEAFDGAAQLVFEHLLATMAGAFFGGSRDWADQVWDAGWAFDRFLESEPSLANFLFIATYAPPARIGRVLDFVLAFALFVEGGNRSRPDDAQLTRTITEAIVCSVLEAVNYQIRHERVYELRGLIPAITYSVFAPFMGSEAADEFVRSKVAATLSAEPAN